MSRAFTIGIEQIRRRLRKTRTPEEAKFISLFGATDAYVKYSQGIDSAFTKHMVMDQALDWDLPFPSSIPLDNTLLPPVFNEIDDNVHKVASQPQPSARQSHAVPVLVNNTDEISLNRGGVESDVAELLVFLNSAGAKVKEVREISNGVTKIALEDLIPPMQTREPEPVRVGGLRK